VGECTDEVGGAMLATTASSRDGPHPAQAAMPPSSALSGSGGRFVERWRGGPAPGEPEPKGWTSPGMRRAESGLGLEWSLCGCTGWNIDRLPVTKDSPKVSTLKSGVVGACEDRTMVSTDAMGVVRVVKYFSSARRCFERTTNM